MSTSVTLDVSSFHRALSSSGVLKIAHSGELPWILASIDEEDVVSFNIEATVMLVGLICLGYHLITKDTIAIVWPEVYINEMRTHGLFNTWCHKEAKFSTDLVSPLTKTTVYINRCFT